MGKVFIVRHGQTDWNVLGKLQGRKDIGLNELGKEQAVKAGEQLKGKNIDLIITSSLKRAKETAEIINKQFNVEIIEDSRLVERDFGDFEGLTKAEIEEKKKQYPEYNDYFNYSKNVKVLNMETIQELCSRANTFLDEMVTRYKDKNILIVTHASISIPIKCYFMKYPLENIITRDTVKGLKNCEVVEFKI